MPPRLATTLRRRPGRPRKFATPSRALTLTLPENVLEALASVHADLSRAVVRLVERRRPEATRPPAELAMFGQRAVITIRPTPALEQRTGVQLVPLPDGRALISFDQPHTIEELELLLYDALDDERLETEDREVFEGIAAILTEARRSRDVKLLRHTIIVLESPQSAPRSRTRHRRGS